MTMLDRMRRHKSWLKWSLAVVVATFVLLYVPQFMSPSTGMAGATDTIATVNGRKITAGTYQQLYLRQVSQLQSQYGELSEQVIRQLGIAQRLVERLVAEEAVLTEAERLGITVSDAELKERLVRSPMFQDNGQFVGEQTYRQMLASARPPVTPAQFEEDMRRSIMGEKLQTAITGWVRVSDADVENEFRRRNEKVRLDVATFTADRFRSAVQVTPEDLTQQFSKNPEGYRIPEKRRVRYLAVDPEALRAKMTVTPQEVEARYREQIQTYSTPEQVRASHILLKTEGKDEAAVRKVAEGVLAKVKAGGDFAALSTQYSEDEVSKASGGDLDFFGKGGMVKEFEDAAWALQPGQTSALVKTQFGFHIIRVTDKRAATTRSLDEVRTSLEDGMRFEKARAEATKVSTEIAGQIKAPADLDRIAKERGLTVGDSGLFSRDEPLSGLGFAPSVATEAFTLEAGKVSGQISTNQGYAFISVEEIKPSYVPKMEEVEARVREDVVRAKALVIAEQRAAVVSKAGANFAAAAKTAGVDVKPTDLLLRGSALPDVGVSDKIDTVAFGLKAGEVSAPITTDTAVVVVRVRERQDASPDALTAGRDSLRTELTQQRGGEFFEAYMAKARAKMTIQYNEPVLRPLLSGS